MELQDILAYNRHLGVESESDNDSDENAELDAMYNLYKPPPFQYEEIQHEIVKISPHKPPQTINVWEQRLKPQQNESSNSETQHIESESNVHGVLTSKEPSCSSTKYSAPNIAITNNYEVAKRKKKKHSANATLESSTNSSLSIKIDPFYRNLIGSNYGAASLSSFTDKSAHNSVEHMPAPVTLEQTVSFSSSTSRQILEESRDKKDQTSVINKGNKFASKEPQNSSPLTSVISVASNGITKENVSSSKRQKPNVTLSKSDVNRNLVSPFNLFGSHNLPSCSCKEKLLTTTAKSSKTSTDMKCNSHSSEKVKKKKKKKGKVQSTSLEIERQNAKADTVKYDPSSLNSANNMYPPDSGYEQFLTIVDSKTENTNKEQRKVLPSVSLRAQNVCHLDVSEFTNMARAKVDKMIEKINKHRQLCSNLSKDTSLRFYYYGFNGEENYLYLTSISDKLKLPENKHLIEKIEQMKDGLMNSSCEAGEDTHFENKSVVKNKKRKNKVKKRRLCKNLLKDTSLSFYYDDFYDDDNFLPFLEFKQKYLYLTLDNLKLPENIRLKETEQKTEHTNDGLMSPSCIAVEDTHFENKSVVVKKNKKNVKLISNFEELQESKFEYVHINKLDPSDGLNCRTNFDETQFEHISVDQLCENLSKDTFNFHYYGFEFNDNFSSFLQFRERYLHMNLDSREETENKPLVETLHITDLEDLPYKIGDMNLDSREETENKPLVETLHITDLEDLPYKIGDIILIILSVKLISSFITHIFMWFTENLFHFVLILFLLYLAQERK